MELIEYYQNQQHFCENYVVRKTQIPQTGNINLYGTRGAGKSAMVLDFLQEQEAESRLYIDLDDPNLILSKLTEQLLQHYIETHNITLLILDHYTEGYFSTFPTVERMIIVSRIPINNTLLIPLKLFPLDYEEFLAFDTPTSTTNTFNHYLRRGTLPTMAKVHKSGTTTMKTFMQSHFDLNEQKLLIILAHHNTKHLTTHQIYTYAKEKFKVSKDWLYRTIKAFTQEQLLLFAEDRYHKSGKKILLFDFAFAKYLTTGQPFIIQFDAMVALALFKHAISFETLGIHGYITRNNELIIPAPFESEESLWVKSQSKFSLYKKHGVKKVTIVTVANSYEYAIEKIHFEALPFYEWTVLDSEDFSID